MPKRYGISSYGDLSFRAKLQIASDLARKL